MNLIGDKAVVYGGSDGVECFSDVFILELGGSLAASSGHGPALFYHDTNAMIGMPRRDAHMDSNTDLCSFPALSSAFSHCHPHHTSPPPHSRWARWDGVQEQSYRVRPRRPHLHRVCSRVQRQARWTDEERIPYCKPLVDQWDQCWRTAVPPAHAPECPGQPRYSEDPLVGRV